MTVESFVRRQIQLDLLSREQGRLVRLVVFSQAPHGGYWRLLTPGPTRDWMRANIGGTMPEMAARIYLIDASWAVRSFWRSFAAFMRPYEYKIKVMGSDYQEQLMHLVDHRAFAIITNLRTKHQMSMQNGAWDHQRVLQADQKAEVGDGAGDGDDEDGGGAHAWHHGSSSDSGAVPGSRFDAKRGNGEDGDDGGDFFDSLQQQSFNRRGEATLKNGGEYEVAIEIDPDTVAGVSWRFQVRAFFLHV